MFHLMMRWLLLLIATLLATLGISAAALVAEAGVFSTPILLPQEGRWKFAVNDRGEAIAITGTEHGALVYPVERESLGSPSLLAVPGGYAAFGVSAVLDDQRRIAVALVYLDETSAGDNESHGSPACCGRVAIASWQLGKPAPAAQSLTPKLSSAAGIGHSPSYPAIVLGPDAVTALWTLGAGEQTTDEGEQRVQLKEAFGPFGGPYSSRTLMSAPRGIWNFMLTQSPRGTPVASWVDDVNKLRSVGGLPDGELHHSHHSQALHGLIKEYSEGFAAHGIGSPSVFDYFTPGTHGSKLLRMVSSHAGAAFSKPRVIRRVPPKYQEASVLVNRSGALLAGWAWTTDDERSYTSQHHVRYAAGSLTGSFGRTLAAPVLPDESEAFLGGHNEDIVIYRSPFGSLLDAVSAKPGAPFEHPHTIDAGLPLCGLDPEDNQKRLEPERVASSADGHAIITIDCEDHHQYAIRYSP